MRNRTARRSRSFSIGSVRAVPGIARFCALAAVLGAALGAGCGGEPGDGKKSAESVLQVGMVFDIGGLGDKSFNDSAYRGLLKARDELGIQFEYYEPAEGSEREAALRLFASGDAAVIFGIGFLFSDDIKKVAAEFPDKTFACVDMTWQEGDSLPPNLAGIKFREEQSSFLAGALAGMVTKTGTIGFIGGMDIPLIHKFEAGYRAGAGHVRPEVQVLAQYAGVTGDAFQNPTKGKELALAQIDAGADILFHASGSTGLGVFEAARARNVLAIGVDADQQAEAPGHVLTSVVKQVDTSVFEVVRSVKEGRFQGGVRVFGLAEGGVDYIRDENNAQWITPEIQARLEELRAQIIAGTLVVPVQ